MPQSAEKLLDLVAAPAQVGGMALIFGGVAALAGL